MYNLCVTIMYGCTRHPDSMSDSFILRNSDVPDVFEEESRVQGWLMEDMRYPLRTWLMTPVRRPEADAETQYNEAHVATRSIVERYIGLLKMQFRPGPLWWGPPI